MPASTVIATKHQERLARRLVTQIAEPRFIAVDSAETTVEVPGELSALLRRVVCALAEGGSLTIQLLPAELTTTIAAAELGVSRPTLMRMIRDGELPAYKVGSHHRLKRADVETFRRDRLERQRAAFEELRLLEAEH